MKRQTERWNSIFLHILLFHILLLFGIYSISPVENALSCFYHAWIYKTKPLFPTLNQMKFYPNNSQPNIWLPDELRLITNFNSENKDNSTWSKTLTKNDWINDNVMYPNQVQDAYQLINSSDQVSNRSPNVAYEALCLVTSSGHEYFSVDGKEVNSINMMPRATKSYDNTIPSSVMNYKENDMKYCQTSFVWILSVQYVES